MKKYILAPLATLMLLLAATNLFADCPGNSFTLTGNTPLCAGETISLNAGGAVAYSWSGPNGFTSTSATPTITNATTAAKGWYYITYTGAGSCQQLDSIYIKVNSLPYATISPTGPTLICPGDSIQLSAFRSTTATTQYIRPDGGLGSTADRNCPTGYVAVGYNTRTGAWLDQITLACKKLNSDGTLGSTVVYTAQSGGNGGGPNGPYLFSGDNVMVGMSTHAMSTTEFYGCGGFAQSISHILADSNNRQGAITGTFLTSGGSSVRTDSIFVPAGAVVVGMHLLNSGNNYASTFSLNYSYIADMLNTYQWSTGATTASIYAKTDGNYTVTVTSGAGCVDSSHTPAVVTVNPTALEIYCPDTIFVSTAGSSANVSFTVGVTSCGSSATLVSQPASGSSFPIGTTIVHSMATRAGGDTVRCSFAVVVTDIAAPDINCGGDLRVAMAPDSCGATVNLISPFASDNTSPTTPLYFYYNGTTQAWTVPAGVHSILVDAFGAMGGYDSWYSTSGGPGAQVHTLLSVTPGQTLYITPGGMGAPNIAGYNGGGAPSTDLTQSGGGGGGQTSIGLAGNGLTDTLIVAGGGGGAGADQTFTCYNYGGYGGAPIGTGGLLCNNIDGTGATQYAGGNGLGNGAFMQGGSGTDTGSYTGGGGGGGFYGGGAGTNGGGGGGSSYAQPGLTSGTTYTYASNYGDGYAVIYVPTITTVQTGGLASGSFFPSGSNTVTFTATDPSGNASSCSYNVLVIDTSSLTLNKPDSVVAYAAPGDCGAVVNFTVTATDRCGATYPVNSLPVSGSFFPTGTSYVANTAVNLNGQTTYGLLKIVVIDTTPPVITCSTGDIAVEPDAGYCGAIVNFSDPSITDECNNSQTVSFGLTGFTQPWIVPPGVTSIYIQAAGGAGGYDNFFGFNGGYGGYAETNLAVTPGQVLYITVGGMSLDATGGFNGGGNAGTDGNGYHGGGGGGQTNIGFAGNILGDTVVVAAGGGGAGLDYNNWCFDEYGGNGGSPNGDDGSYCYSSDGGGATQSAPGAGPGTAGTYMHGGSAVSNFAANGGGGGGGGGYYGGGSGSMGGGGGGSSFITSVGASGSNYIGGYNGGDGFVNISYTPQFTYAQTQGPPSGTLFPLGKTTVTYTATDASGNSASCSFNIIVRQDSSTINQTICQGTSYSFNGMALTQTGTYLDTIPTSGLGCDSIIVLNLTVLPAGGDTISQTICNGQSYAFNGQNLTVGGTYYDTLQAQSGCDSLVTLNLTVITNLSSTINQSICYGSSYTFNGVDLTATGNYYDTLSSVNGCDSIITLNLTVLPAAGSTINQSICPNQSYAFNGQNLNATGTYYDTLTAGSGCDSIITLNLNVLSAAGITINQTICANQTFDFNGQSLNSNGTYYDTLTAVNGCDSVITLNLTILPTASSTINQTICANQTFAFNGQALNSNGTYYDTLTAVNGCDSLITLNLTVLPTAASTINQTICANQTFAFNGQALNSNGTYYDTLTAVNGCDSVITLNLTVLPTAASTINQTICANQTFAFNGQALNSNGTYYDTLTAVNGCDSVITLNLTVLPTAASTINQTICANQTFDFNGQALNSNGIYYDTLTAVNGCDSVITLNLTVLPTAASTINQTICANQTFDFNDQSLNSNGTYYDTLTAVNGCDSLITLNLTVLPTAASTINQTICANQTFAFNGQALNSNGTYYDTLTAVNGCDSLITLNLTVLPTSASTINQTICANQTFAFNGQALSSNGTYYDTLTAINGCDSIITLNLTVLPTAASTINQTICANQTFDFNGQALNSNGIYYDTLTAVNGCDSVITLNLTVLSTSASTINQTICANQTFDFNGQALNSNGTYYDTLTAVNGCDSVITLNLTVLPTAASTINQTICANQTFDFNGQSLNSNGTYYDTLTAVNGCDSVITLNLTVLPTAASTINQTICANQTFAFNGQALNSNGTYYDTLTAVNGCDSVITLNLTVLPTATSTINQTICANQAFDFNGQALNSNGIYYDTLTSVNGCDSLITLNLTVLPTAASTINQTICANQVYTFNGQDLNTDGIYYDTLTAVNGCDSLITLNLTVLSADTTILDETICANQSYAFNGLDLSSDGTYYDTLTSGTGCDSLVILNLTVLPTAASTLNQTICANQTFAFNGQNLNADGIYYDTLTAVNGCDSVVTLNLMVLPTAASAISQTICSNEIYAFNGQNLNSAGVYYDTLVADNGCDSIVTLTLIVNQVSASTVNATICQGQTYSFNGTALGSAGVYYDTLSNAAGCDSIITLNLNVNSTLTTTIDENICQGTMFNFNGLGLTTQGTYYDTLTSSGGCDSIITLNLTVFANDSTVIDQTICANQIYTFNGIDLNTTGVYTRRFANVHGCDSLITLNLTVLPVVTDTIVQTICDNQSFTFNGNVITTAGTYSDTLTGDNGCDSIVTLSLTVLPTAATTLNQTICANETYNFNGQNLNANGTYYDTLTSVNGCDSVVTLNLSILPVAATAINQTICANQTFDFNGQLLNADGTYYDTLTAANGCDSVVTLTLSVLPTEATTLNQNICPGQSYTFAGQTLSSTGIYYDTLTSVNGCDSVVTLNLTVNQITTGSITANICLGQSYTFNGINLTSTGIYLDTLTSSNGCDSIVTLNLTVNSMFNSTINQSICSGSSYTFNGIDLTDAGTYYDTLTAAGGCDSIITLNLTVLSADTTVLDQTICANQTYAFNGLNLSANGTYYDTLSTSGGCDSLVVLNLTVLPTAASTLNQTICANQTFTFNGQNLNADGTYYDTLTSANGCDSLVTLNLTILPTAAGTISQTICANETFAFNGQNLNTDGTYYDTLTAANGCDSIITLTLNVLPTAASHVSQTICGNQTFDFNGQNLNVGGTYYDTLTSVNGCDSLITLDLTVLQNVTATINQTICTNETYPFAGQNLNSDGVYYDTLTAVNGCDSVITLNLTVLPTASTTLNRTICNNQTYLFNGQNLNTDGTYYDTLTSVNGCDSLITLNLSVLPVITSTLNRTICSNDSYTFNGQTLTTTGIYYDTLTAVGGCDSIVTLNLTVNSASTGSISASICQGQSYLFNGVNLTATGSYLDTLVNSVGCDSVLTLNLTVGAPSTTAIAQSICSGTSYTFNGVDLTTTGIYYDTLTSVGGCDSIIMLNLTVNQVVTGSQTLVLCAGQTVQVGTHTYNSTGTYTDTLVSSAGCDSIITLHLTVNPAVSTSQTLVVCAGQVVHVGIHNYNSTGTYTDTLTSTNGCDSIITTLLTVKPVATTTQTFTQCAGTSVTVGGHTYTQTGTYTDTLTGVNGCDSIVTTHLTISNVGTINVYDTICQGGIYLFNGQNLTVAGTYADTTLSSGGCDSITVLHLFLNPLPNPSIGQIHDTLSTGTETSYQWYLNNNPIPGATNQQYVVTQNGTYYVAVTDQFGCSNTSPSTTITGVGINEVGHAFNLKLFPNPNSGIFTVQHNYNGQLNLEVYSTIGDKVREFTLTDNTGYFDITDLAAGVYYVQVTSGKQLLSIIKVVKQ